MVLLLQFHFCDELLCVNIYYSVCHSFLLGFFYYFVFFLCSNTSHFNFISFLNLIQIIDISYLYDFFANIFFITYTYSFWVSSFLLSHFVVSSFWLSPGLLFLSTPAKPTVSACVSP